LKLSLISIRLFRRSCLVAFLIALYLCSCSPYHQEQNQVKEIRFCTLQLRPAFDDYFSEIFEEFEKTHPGVKIRWLDLPYQNYQSKIVTSFLGKHSADVINLSTQIIPDFARAGFIRNLDPLAPAEMLEVYLPNLLEEACSHEGDTYALPWYVASGVTMINRKILEEAGIGPDEVPQFFEDIPEFCRVIRERTDKFGVFPIYTEGGSIRLFLEEAGIPIIDPESGKAALYTPEAIKVIKFWTDLYKQGLVPSESLTAGHQRPIELYKTGRLAIFGSGPQFLRQIKSDAPDVYENTLVYPQLCWKRNKFYRAEVQVLCISNQSEYPELALEFAAFVTNPENQLKFCKLTTILPSVKAGLEDPFFTKVDDDPQGQARKISAEQLDSAVVSQALPKAGLIYPVLNNMAESICLGKVDVETGMKEAEERINEILRK
jgi:putative chitobiose transport system substrate-binding protein